MTDNDNDRRCRGLSPSGAWCTNAVSFWVEGDDLVSDGMCVRHGTGIAVSRFTRPRNNRPAQSVAQIVDELMADDDFHSIPPWRTRNPESSSLEPPFKWDERSQENRRRRKEAERLQAEAETVAYWLGVYTERARCAALYREAKAARVGMLLLQPASRRDLVDVSALYDRGLEYSERSRRSRKIRKRMQAIWEAA